MRVGRRCGLQSRLPTSAGVVVSVGVPASPHSLPWMSPRPLGAQDAVFTVLLGYVCHVKLGPGVREKEDGHLPSSRDKLSGSGLPSVPHPWGPVQVAVTVPAPCVWRPRGPRLPAEVRPSTSTLRAAPRSPSHSPGGWPVQAETLPGGPTPRLPSADPTLPAGHWLASAPTERKCCCKCKCKCKTGPRPRAGERTGPGPGPGQRLAPASVLWPP